ncbi:MAG: family 20 glycosylhydrolase [Saprospiraceae bacterium]|nr:family 20 glycosylhydrolase [Saprospiraceae bacterium]
MKAGLFFLTILYFSTLNSQERKIDIIPIPVSVTISFGSFRLTNSTSVGYNNTEASKSALLFAKAIKNPTGFIYEPVSSNNASIQFSLNNLPVPQIGSEGYTLKVELNRIIISANSDAGLYYGLQTLLQLFPKEIENKTLVNTIWEIPCVQITDFPRFPWRGIMLDVSRHFFTKEEIMTYIDQISKYKFNTFHWHLTDDNGWRIEIKALPKLTQVGAWRVERFGRFGSRADPKPGESATDGGFYTQEEIKDIIAFADQRHVTIVPEIDVPGHSMAALAAYPDLSCTKDTSIKVNPGTKFSEWYDDGTFKMLLDNTLNPSDEKVYEFLDKIFTEVSLLFPNQYIHVGGDECYKGYWKNDIGCQKLMKKLKLREVEQLQGYFMGRVNEILKQKGKKLLGWEEILEGGISQDATVMGWRGTKGGIKGAKNGYNVVMTPSTFAYLDYFQGEKSIEPPVYEGLRTIKVYNFEPVPEGIDSKYILGGQGNLWTEQIANFRQVQYMTYPRAWALSEKFWSPKDKSSWDEFTNRMEVHFLRADLAEINHSNAVYDPIIKVRKEKGQLSVLIEKEISDINIYYTIDDSMPDSFSPEYIDSLALPDGPITLRMISYRNNKPIGHLITLKRDELEKRAK